MAINHVVILKVGRRIFRERLETGDRESDMVQRRVSFFHIIFHSTVILKDQGKSMDG